MFSMTYESFSRHENSLKTNFYIFVSHLGAYVLRKDAKNVNDNRVKYQNGHWFSSAPRTLFSFL